MVSLPLVALAVGTTLLAAGTYGLAQYRGRRSSGCASRALAVLGNGTMATALVGFEGAFDLVTDPGFPDLVGDSLLVFSLACLVASLLVRRRSRS